MKNLLIALFATLSLTLLMSSCKTMSNVGNDGYGPSENTMIARMNVLRDAIGELKTNEVLRDDQVTASITILDRMDELTKQRTLGSTARSFRINLEDKKRNKKYVFEAKFGFKVGDFRAYLFNGFSVNKKISYYTVEIASLQVSDSRKSVNYSMVPNPAHSGQGLLNYAFGKETESRESFNDFLYDYLDFFEKEFENKGIDLAGC